MRCFNKERILQAKSNIWTFIRYVTGYYRIELERPSPEQLKDRRRNTIITIAIMVIAVVLAIYGNYWLQFYNRILNTKMDAAHWLAYISGYWGAIIGAILAGLITIITTAMIIRRSYKIDYHRERLDHMPFLSITYYKQYHDNFGKKNECYIIDNFPDKQASILNIKNVGKGIAINIKTQGFTDEHLEAMIPTLIVNESKYLVGYISEEQYNFTIKYCDIFENEYEQLFGIKFIGNKIVFTNNIPILVKKTIRYRYTQ